jgi:hypothetical protein
MPLIQAEYSDSLCHVTLCEVLYQLCGGKRPAKDHLEETAVFSSPPIMCKEQRGGDNKNFTETEGSQKGAI